MEDIVDIYFFPLNRAFDVELLYIAQQLGIPIEERAVNWEEIDGKMIFINLGLLFFCWLQMRPGVFGFHNHIGKAN